MKQPVDLPTLVWKCLCCQSHELLSSFLLLLLQQQLLLTFIL